MARLGITAPLQKVEALREPVEQLPRREQTGSRRGQLHSEREVVEAPAELGDLLVRLDAGAGAKQLDCIRLGKWKDFVLGLASDPQQLAARDQQSQIRAGFDQRGQLGSRLDHLLKVVEQEQERALADVLGKSVFRPQRLRDRLLNQLRITKRRQSDPEDAVLELGNEFCRGLDRQPRLARPPRAGQGHEARFFEQRGDLGFLAFPADERARRPRQVRVRDRSQRRELPGSELEDPDRLVEVLQPVLPQIE